MTDMSEMIRDKVKDAVEEKLGGIFRDFLAKEFVEQERYRELLAVWLIAHPELYSYPKILEVECHRREYCEVGNIRILEYKTIIAITKQTMKSHESDIIASVQSVLDTIIKNPSSVDEKITARQIYNSTVNSLGEGIQKYVENQGDTLEFEVGYKSVYIEPTKMLSKAAGFILGNTPEVVEYFEKELMENIKVLSSDAKLTVIILSAYPRIFQGYSFDLGVLDTLRDIISQGTIHIPETDKWRLREELYKAGLIASADKNIVPPFTLDIWKNAINIREIISDVPPEVVKRVRMILSWRGE